MSLKWCQLHDLPEPCDKCKPKTPDVREALKHLMAEYGAEVMAKVELGNTELLAELCEQATEELLDKHIQPLIEAAELRGISTGTTAYESTCEALIKEAKKEERAKLCTQCNYAPDSRYNVEAARTERDEYWKDKITTYITSDVRKVDNED